MSRRVSCKPGDTEQPNGTGEDCHYLVRSQGSGGIDNPLHASYELESEEYSRIPGLCFRILSGQASEELITIAEKIGTGPEKDERCDCDKIQNQRRE